MRADHARSRTVVLCYHTVGAPYGVSVEQFERQLRYLKERAQVVTLDAIVDGSYRESTARLTCAITFDDGYASVYEQAYPSLRRYGLPAALYVTTEAIGEHGSRDSDDCEGFLRGERTLTWGQLREMSADGITIGSHLCRHRALTRLTRAQALTELRLSKEIVTERLGQPCRHFAYPYGSHNRQTSDWLRQSGYESAVTIQHRAVSLDVDVFRIPRIMIPRLYADLDAFGPNDFSGMLWGSFDYVRLELAARNFGSRAGELLRRVFAGA